MGTGSYPKLAAQPHPRPAEEETLLFLALYGALLRRLSCFLRYHFLACHTSPSS